MSKKLDQAIERIERLEKLMQTKEPTYTYNWLYDIICQHYPYYKDIFTVLPNGIYSPLEPIDGATVMLRVLSKEFGQGGWGISYFLPTQAYGTYEISGRTDKIYGVIGFKDQATAEKVIDIVVKNFPMLLSNYFHK